MLTSPFDVGPKKQQFDVDSFDNSEVIFVSDMYSSEYVGGAELTTDTIIDSSPINCFRLKSNQTSVELIQRGVGKYWVFCNYTNMNHQLIPLIIANLSYSIVEYDYKFCKYRSIEKHKEIENSECDCHEQMQGKLTSAFFHGSDSVFWMAQKQLERYTERFPFLAHGNNHILSSVFTDEILDRLRDIREGLKERSEKWIVIGSTSWIKGAKQAQELCDKEDLECDVVWGIPYEEMLDKLGSSRGHVFTPLGGDTCPRSVIEAKLAGCDLILNENVQHKDEAWFTGSPGEIEQYLRSSTDRFWKRLSSFINKVETISGYTTVKDCVSQGYPFEQCIKSMLGFCDQVVVADGGSTDGTWERLEELSLDDDRIVISQNKRDWSHKRFAVFDGLQKAYARSLCTGDWCWQQDSDEIVHENDYDKVKVLIKRLPKATDLLALPVIEYWGGPDKVRIDVNPWKWRLSRNRSYITHGIPKELRLVDEEGFLYARPGTDGCDYIDTDTYEPIPCTTFYTKDVHDLRVTAIRGNKEAIDKYEQWYNNVTNALPGIYHYSWYDLERKINTYKNYWSKHWQSLYNVQQDDTIENNMFFNKKWSSVTDVDIENLSKRLRAEMGGWIFHKKIDFAKPTNSIVIHRDQPQIMING